MSQYPGLASYFISECKFEIKQLGLANINLDEYFFVVPELSTGREGRLACVYSSKVTEVYLLFLQFALQVFFYFNKFFQREDSVLPVLLQQIESFLCKLFGRFVIPSIIKNAVSVASVDYSMGNQLSGSCMHFLIITSFF